MPTMYVCSTCNSSNDISYYDSLDLDLCAECYNDNYFECELCECEHSRDSGHYIESESIIICSDCYDSDYNYCAECNEDYHNNNLRDALDYRGRSVAICEYCIDNYYHCETCGSIIHSDIAYFDNSDSVYCSECYENRPNQILHSYGYKPYPIFYKLNNNIAQRLFTGIELETSNNDNDIDNCISEIYNKYEMFYAKEDSSIDGAELVSHPFSREYYNANKDIFDNVLSIFKSHGFTSHKDGTCGMHVHINKTYVSRLDILKLLRLFYYNRDKILKLSQRSERSFSRWSNINTDIHNFTDYARRRYAQHRGALNLMNCNTIEFRIFRGTLLSKRFHKNIETVYSLIDYVKSSAINNIQDWRRYIDYIDKNHKEYKNLYNFISEKDLF